MSRKILLVLLCIMIVSTLVSGVLVSRRNYELRYNILFGDDKPGYDATLKLTANVHIRVVRDGETIYVYNKSNDPITIQWYRMVANMMLGLIRKNPLTFYDINNNQHTWIDTEYAQYSSVGRTGTYNPQAYIALGNGTGTISLYDRKLFSEVVKDTPDMSVTDDTANSQYIVMYTKTFTIDENFTLSEVGLELLADVNPNTGTDVLNLVYILIAHDTIDQPVALEVGDAVTVTYEIILPYSTSGPFTKWFYNALITYFLGYKGTTGNYLTLTTESGTTGEIDTATDDYTSTTAVNVGYADDKVDGEYIYVEIGTGTSTTNPLWETYSLASKSQSIRIDDQQFLVQVDESNTFKIKYIASLSFTSATTVSEIGLSYYTDTEADGHYDSYGRWFYDSSYGWYLWMYWIVSPAISVGAGDGLRVEITITIPYV